MEDQSGPRPDRATDDEETISAESESPTRFPTPRRELVVKEGTNNEDDSSALLNMTENLPDEYDEQSRPSRGQIEAEGDRATTDGQLVARPESLQDYLDHKLSGSTSARHPADGRPDHLQPRFECYLKSPL